MFIGLVHYCLLMGSLYLVDPKTAGWLPKTGIMIWYVGSIVLVWSFLDWFNDYCVTAKAFPGGYPKTWREWLLPPKKEGK
jgi:hypothetical protein